MQRILITSIIVSCLTFQSFGQTADTKSYTLKQCVEAAVANNLDVRLSGLEVETNKTNRDQSRAEVLPSLNGSVGHGINQGRSIDPYTNGYINQRINTADYNVNSELVLFNGFSVRNNIKKNTLDYEAAKMDWQQQKDNVTISVILAYLDVMTDQDLITQGEKQVDLTQKQVQRLGILNDNGSIKPSDLSDLKGQLANDQLSLISNRNALETAKLNLCKLMNIPYDKSMQLERFDAEAIASSYPDMPSDIYNKALSQFAHIKYTELKTKSAESLVKVYQGRLFPRLTLNGNAGSNYSSAASQNTFLTTTTMVNTGNYVIIGGTPSSVFHDQPDFRTDKIGYTKQLNNNISTYFSINLSVPIFNHLSARSNVKLARIQAKSSSLTEQTAKTQLQQNIEQSYLNMSSTYDRYKTLLDQVNSYQESFRAAEIRFNEGVGNSIDYLTARNNFDRANNNLIIAKYDYVIRTKILDYYQGKLTW